MEPYENRLTSNVIFEDKLPVIGSIVAVLKGRIEKRGMKLIYPESRVLRCGEIFELSYSDENVKPGEKVDRVSYLGFLEVTQGGVLKVGDEVYSNKELLGTIAGFDETHAPNHQNVLLFASKLLLADFRGLKLKERIIFSAPGHNFNLPKEDYF